jgi:hypothetical protein
MHDKRVKTFRSYLLHCWPEPCGTPGEPSTWCFTVEDVSGEQQRQEFRTFEQVMNFLLDELLGQPKEVQKMNDD